MPTPTSTLRHRLIAARKLRKLSQEDLARSARCTVGHIGKLECGDTQGSHALLRRIADALDVSPGWLVFGEGRAPRGLS